MKELNSKIPLTVIAKSPSIKLDGKRLSDLIGFPRPILIHWDGLFSWINIHKVKNMIRNIGDAKLRAKANNQQYMPCMVFKFNRNVVDNHLAEAIVALLEKK